METSKIIIYSKEVQVITGKSLRSSQRLLQSIRKKLNKKKSHLVTITEFCDYSELSPEEVNKALDK